MTGRLLTLARQVLRSDYLPIFFLITAVQGTVLISQALSAFIVPAAELGVIRTFESVFAVFVLVASFGAPSLSIREMAIARHSADHALMLRDLMLLPVMGAILSALVAIILILAGVPLIEGPALSLGLGIFLLIAVNFVRLIAAVAQGLQIVRQVYLAVLGGALACMVAQVLGAAAGTATSWVIGRLAGEAILLISLLLSAKGCLPAVEWSAPMNFRRLAKTMASATTLNLALIVRMMADAAPITLLSMIAAGTLLGPNGTDHHLRSEIGYFGFATLAMTLAMLPISIVSQREQPILTQASLADKDRLAASLRRRMLLAALMIALPLMAAAGALYLAGVPKILPAMLPAAVLFAVMPIRAAALARAGILMAHGRYSPILATNVVELAVSIIYVLLIGQSASKWTGVAAIAIGSSVSLIGLYLVERRSPRAAA